MPGKKNHPSFPDLKNPTANGRPERSLAASSRNRHFFGDETAGGGRKLRRTMVSTTIAEDPDSAEKEEAVQHKDKSRPNEQKTSPIGQTRNRTDLDDDKSGNGGTKIKKRKMKGSTEIVEEQSSDDEEVAVQPKAKSRQKKRKTAPTRREGSDLDDDGSGKGGQKHKKGKKKAWTENQEEQSSHEKEVAVQGQKKQKTAQTGRTIEESDQKDDKIDESPKHLTGNGEEDKESSESSENSESSDDEYVDPENTKVAAAEKTPQRKPKDCKKPEEITKKTPTEKKIKSSSKANKLPFDRTFWSSTSSDKGGKAESGRKKFQRQVIAVKKPNASTENMWNPAEAARKYLFDATNGVPFPADQKAENLKVAMKQKRKLSSSAFLDLAAKYRTLGDATNEEMALGVAWVTEMFNRGVDANTDGAPFAAVKFRFDENIIIKDGNFNLTTPSGSVLQISKRIVDKIVKKANMRELDDCTRGVVSVVMSELLLIDKWTPVYSAPKTSKSVYIPIGHQFLHELNQFILRGCRVQDIVDNYAQVENRNFEILRACVNNWLMKVRVSLEDEMGEGICIQKCDEYKEIFGLQDESEEDGSGEEDN